jgi:hypothetical protein
VRRKTWTTRAIVSAVSASIHCRLIHPPVAPTRMPSSQNGHETARPARIWGKAVVLRSLRRRQERWRSQLGRTRPRPCMLRWHASWPHRRTRRLTAVSALQAQLGVRQARSKRAPRQVVPAGRRAAAPAAPCSPRVDLGRLLRRLCRSDSRFGLDQWTWWEPANTAISALASRSGSAKDRGLAQRRYTTNDVRWASVSYRERAGALYSWVSQ